MSKRFFVLQQVSEHTFCKSFRSDDRFVVVLPCPEVLFDTYSEALLLITSGDIELNPGPDSRLEEMIAEVLENQKQMRAEIKKVNENQIASQKRQEEMARKIAKLEAALTDLQVSNKQITQLQETVSQLEETIRLQHEKLIDLEDRGRRNNLIVFGIPEAQNETDDEVKTKVVTDLFLNKLGVTIKTLERIHRLGKRKEGITRPIILKLFDYNEKVEVFRNCKKLKGTKISISNDYSQDTLVKRKNLWASTSAERANNSRVRLIHDKIQVNGDTFYWSESEGHRVKVSSRRSPERNSK
ncbi:unnamed protein product [Ixodes persulcatus]